MSLDRYTVHNQSVQCPDGYARDLFYIWDRRKGTIVGADYERAIAEGDAARLNRAECAS